MTKSLKHEAHMRSIVLSGRLILMAQQGVATYARACLEGRSLIVSLRRDVGGRAERASTIELVPGGDRGRGLAAPFDVGGRPYAMIQHSGRENQAPPEGAAAAAERLRLRLALGDVAVDESALESRPAEPDGTGIPARDLFPMWRRLLPRRWSKLDFDALLEALA
jgi:hypothetical protein